MFHNLTIQKVTINVLNLGFRVLDLQNSLNACSLQHFPYTESFCFSPLMSDLSPHLSPPLFLKGLKGIQHLFFPLLKPQP